jgi:hypothetical protein
MSRAALLPTIDPSPFARDAIAAALRALRTDSDRYWSALSTHEFFASLGSGWSPAENVRHLTKSVRAVRMGVAMPRLVLLVRFGPARGRSRPLDEIRTAYHGVLAKGGKAGRFAPSKENDVGDHEARRRAIMTAHTEAVEALAAALMRWNDASLDRYRLPHPLLGKLTVREMLLFTLYHNLHHVRVVARRRGEIAGDETPLQT